MSIACTTCGSPIPDGFAFCGHCGASSEPPAPPGYPPSFMAGPPPGPPPGAYPGAAPIQAAVQARLVVLRGPVPEGSVYDLRQGRNVVGRQADISFPNDHGIDGEHLVLEVHGPDVQVAAVPGEGGAYRRIRDPAVVQSGDTVFAGEQYLIVRRGDDAPQEQLDPNSAVPEETFGTPLPPPQLHVTQLLSAGVPGRVASTDKSTLSVGRENSDLSFPQDRFMSGRHVRLENNSGTLSVIDVGSLNGTFTHIDDMPVSLRSGDELMVGSVLFRVDVG